MNSFGAAIREAMSKAKLSQAELAKRVGVGQPFVSQVIRGVRPRMGADVFVRICRELSLDAAKMGELIAPPIKKAKKPTK